MTLTKVAGDILDPGISVAGIVTATGFDGPFTGGSSKNITAGIITATELDLNGNVDISGNLVVQGDTTTLNTTLRNVELLRVSAASTLPAGIITQTSTGDILRLYDSSTQVFTVADGGDITLGGGKIYGNTTAAPTFTLQSTSANNNHSRIEIGAIQSSDNGGIHFYTAGSSVATRHMTLKGTSGNLGIGVSNPSFKLDVNGTSNFQNNVTFKGTTSGRDLNWEFGNNKLNLANNVLLGLGTTDGLLLHHTGSTGYIKGQHGNLYIQSDAVVVIGNQTDSTAGLKFTSGGAAELFHNNKVRLATDANGVQIKPNVGGVTQLGIAQTTTTAYSINGTISFINSNNTTSQIQGRTGSASTTGDILFLCNTVGDESLAVLEDGKVRVPDGGKFVAGSGNDLEIYHVSAGGTSYIKESGSGDLLIQGTQIKLQDANGADYLRGFTGGAVYLHNAGNNKFETTSTGVHVTGEVSASQDYPNFQPTADFNFEAEKKLDSRITYFRSGPASYVNQFGKVVLVGDNEPRFDYGYEYVNANSHKLSKGESKGLLIEESRTNLVSYSIYDGDKSGTAQTSSGDIGNWDLTLGHATFTGGIDAPDGSNDAVRFTALNTGFALFRIPIPAFTPNGSDTYTLSFYARAISGTGNITFDLNDGDPTLGSWSNNMITNEWVRIHHSAVPSNASKTFIDIMSNSNNNRVFDIWGVQLEKGSFATSFIPTHGSVATRGHEAVTLEGTDFSDIFGTDFKQFSLVADYDNTQTDDGTQYGIIDLWGESTGYDDRIEWMKDNASPYHIETRSFGGGNATFANGNLSASNKTKSQRFATSWSVPDYSNTSSRRFVVSMGGEAVDVISDGSGTTVPQITRMGIGCNPTRLDFTPGLLHFKRLMVYNKTLSDGQLQNLSAQ